MLAQIGRDIYSHHVTNICYFSAVNSVWKLFFNVLFCFFLKVLIKKDFPFADVPVPSVSYVNDTEATVTMKCSFVFPTWDNVSFEIQWFVNGRGVTPTVICKNPNESICNRRYTRLGTSEYGPGNTVIAYAF